MSKSIFQVRPRDDGKGWAIDEYDGRGAWQSSYFSHKKKTPINKIEAQRRVFQLRREALNSASRTEPVNKATGPSLTAQERAREFIEEHYGYGPPPETVEELALVIERFGADAVSAAVDVCNEIAKSERAGLALPRAHEALSFLGMAKMLDLSSFELSVAIGAAEAWASGERPTPSVTARLLSAPDKKDIIGLVLSKLMRLGPAWR